jgi:CspA family cold shock protein
MSEETQSKLVGKVKWFNNKAGYGFITASEGEHSGKDIFVHYSTINVSNLQYKYLVQGEYVEFELVKSQNDKHEYQATNVVGIKGGQLMCETRNSVKISMSNYKRESQPEPEPEAQAETEVIPRQKRVPRVRGGGPREDSERNTVVQNSSTKKKNSVLATKKLVKNNTVC